MPFVLLSIFLLILLRTAYCKRFPFPTLEKDSNVHLLYVKEIRRNNNRIPDCIPRFIFDTNDYPEGFHKLVALSPLSLEWLRDNGGFFPLLFDSLLLLITALFIAVAGGTHYEWLLIYPVTRMFWYSEDRAFQFGARAFGTLFGNLYLGSAYLFLQTHEPLWALTSLIGFIGFSTASQFAWQATLFFSILESVIGLSWDPLLFFLCCFIVAIPLTRGYSLQVFLGLCRHSYFYKTHLIKTNWGIPNFYQEWGQLLKRFRGSRFEYLFFQNPLPKLISNFPVSLPFLACWYTSGHALTPLTIYGLCAVLMLPAIATEALKFWGEPDRYLEYSTVPMFLYVSQFPVKDHPVLFAVSLLIGVLALRFQIKLKKRESGQESVSEEGYQELIQFVGNLPPSTILTIIIRVSFNLGFFLDQHQYVSFLANIGKGEKYTAYKNLCPQYGSFPCKNIQGTIDQYNVNYLVVSKKYLKALETKIGETDYYDLTPYTTIFESDYFIVYQIQ